MIRSLLAAACPGLVAVLLAAPLGATPAPETSPRPVPRPANLAFERAAAADMAQARAEDFDVWVRDFARRALAEGIPADAINAALGGVRPDGAVIRLDRSQAEFARAIWDYLDAAVSDSRVANGRAALARHRAQLAAIERRWGVPAEVVVAIWGMETSYGAVRGSNDVIRSLATLAHDGRRRAFFEAELVAALRIVAAGDIAPPAMRGSWAGAMGHTQFMPSSYLAHAVDFTGDGRRDIWGEDPTDALASTARYLAHFGWKAGQPWGVEVRLPPGFDYAATGKGTRKSVQAWAALGVRGRDGAVPPDHGRAAILVPAGARGPAFMVFDNFDVIARYNPADAYVLGVGHLSDRIAGGGPIRAAWPRGERVLSADEKRLLQTRLTAAGFDTGGIDGRIGPDTRAAIRRYQAAAGLVADGFATAALLERLR